MLRFACALLITAAMVLSSLTTTANAEVSGVRYLSTLFGQWVKGQTKTSEPEYYTSGVAVMRVNHGSGRNHSLGFVTLKELPGNKVAITGKIVGLRGGVQAYDVDLVYIPTGNCPRVHSGQKLTTLRVQEERNRSNTGTIMTLSGRSTNVDMKDIFKYSAGGTLALRDLVGNEQTFGQIKACSSQKLLILSLEDELKYKANVINSKISVLEKKYLPKIVRPYQLPELERAIIWGV